MFGRVCPTKTSSGNGGDGTTGGGEVACSKEVCELGNCGCCATAEKKCKCIAYTYFQAVHAKHHSHSEGEVTQLAGVQYVAGQCQITTRRHKDCLDLSHYESIKNNPAMNFMFNASDAWTGWVCEGHDNVRQVTFNLSGNEAISVVPNGCDANTGESHGWVSRLLKIGEGVQICFDRCAIAANFDKHTDVKNEKFINWAGCDSQEVWCKHDALEKINGLYIKNTESKKDPITGVEVKHTNYKFYDESDL